MRALSLSDDAIDFSRRLDQPVMEIATQLCKLDLLRLLGKTRPDDVGSVLVRIDSLIETTGALHYATAVDQARAEFGLSR